MIDRGTACASKESLAQLKAYCIFSGTSPITEKERKVLARLGIGKKTSLGMSIIKFTASDIWISFDMHVVDAPISMLMCVANMYKIDMYFNNVTNILVHTAFGRHASIFRT